MTPPLRKKREKHVTARKESSESASTSEPGPEAGAAAESPVDVLSGTPSAAAAAAATDEPQKLPVNASDAAADAFLAGAADQEDTDGGTNDGDDADALSSDGDDAAGASKREKRRSGSTRRGWSGTRLVALIAGVAVVSLLIGIAVMQFIVSPAELASRTAAPKPGPVTAPIEERVIENNVLTRGEVTYADEVAVSIDAAGSGDRPVVTGHVPEVGTILNVGSVALEVAGRPVIALPGALPAYRTLSFGMRGPDVVQLKTALTAMGYWAGDTASDIFEWDTANALSALYEQLGYPSANGGDTAQDALRSAERGVRDANTALAQAQADFNAAVAAGETNPIAQQAAINSAADAVSDAQASLTTAQQGVLATLPASEALFLADLPRRVDAVSVKRGDILQGSPMTVSGATLTIVASVSKQDAELLSEGLTALFNAPGGDELTATVKKISAQKGSTGGSGNGGGEGAPAGGQGGDGQSGAGRYTVTLSPNDLTPAQIDALRGTNVRLTIPLASTEGKVLAVPIAALSSGSGGEDRVELLIDPKSGPDAVTEIIKVETGLAANGYVQIMTTDSRLVAGAKVVVGR